MLNSIRKILLKVQVFTLSQLNGSCQATWNRILLLGHVKLKHRSTLQLHDAVCNFFQQLWRICNDSYFLRWEPNIILLTLYYQFLFFCVFIY